MRVAMAVVRTQVARVRVHYSNIYSAMSNEFNNNYTNK